jgi:hypothetical protein
MTTREAGQISPAQRRTGSDLLYFQLNFSPFFCFFGQKLTFCTFFDLLFI